MKHLFGLLIFFGGSAAHATALSEAAEIISKHLMHDSPALAKSDISVVGKDSLIGKDTFKATTGDGTSTFFRVVKTSEHGFRISSSKGVATYERDLASNEIRAHRFETQLIGDGPSIIKKGDGQLKNATLESRYAPFDYSNVEQAILKPRPAANMPYQYRHDVLALAETANGQITQTFLEIRLYVRNISSPGLTRPIITGEAGATRRLVIPGKVLDQSIKTENGHNILTVTFRHDGTLFEQSYVVDPILTSPRTIGRAKILVDTNQYVVRGLEESSRPIAPKTVQ